MAGRTGTAASKSKRPLARMLCSRLAAASSAAWERGSECSPLQRLQKPQQARVSAAGCALSCSTPLPVRLTRRRAPMRRPESETDRPTRTLMRHAWRDTEITTNVDEPGGGDEC